VPKDKGTNDPRRPRNWKLDAMLIIKLVVAFASLFPALAIAKWVKIYDYTDEGVPHASFINPDILVYTSRTVKVWEIKTEMGEPKVKEKARHIPSAKLYKEFNCNQRQSRILELIVYSERGGGGKSRTMIQDSSPPWENVVPGSGDDEILDHICALPRKKRP
jgi:hypothetical protein